MAYKRKTWKEKMETGLKPSVHRTKRAFADIPAGAAMLVPSPEAVAAYISRIPEGVHTSIQQMRNDLAAQYNAEYTCPVTSGIFLRIVAEAAWDALQEGKPIDEVAPFWRMLDHRSPTCKKLSFGTDFVREQRAREGLPF